MCAAITILVVDDDPKIRKLLRSSLESEGFQVLEACDRASALKAVGDRRVSLVTLDIGLGQDDGFELARTLRRDHDVPIIMVSGRGDVIDKVVGLEIGADDYIVKPFHQRELIARIRSVLRRAEGSPDNRGEPADIGDAADHRVYVFDGMMADPGTMELVGRDGEPIDLTAGDFRLLCTFLDAPKRVLSRDTIMDRVSGANWSPYDRTIDNQVARLRKKIERDPANPALIKTVRGIGYSFATEVSRQARESDAPIAVSIARARSSCR